MAIKKPPQRLPDRPLTDDPRRSPTLPARYYHAPDVFEKEKAKIFFRSWQFAGHASQLKEPGSYITTTIVDQDIIAMRGTDGVLRAFYNVCPHRGATLLEGCGKKKTIVCPYHNWAFDTKGRLKSGRGLDRMPDFDFKDYGLTEMRVEEFATHLVFVNMDPDAPTLASMASSLADEFREAIPHYDDLVLARSDPFDIGVNWKNAIDNFVECYHCPHAHPEFMGSNSSLFPTDEWKNTNHEYYSSHTVLNAQPRSRALQFDASKADFMHGYIWALWPNTLFMAWPPKTNFIVFQVNPRGPEQTFESLDYYFQQSPPTQEMLDIVNYHSNVVNEQDIKLIKGVQRGVHSLGYNQGRYICDDFDSWHSEHAMHHFNHLVWRALHDEL